MISIFVIMCKLLSFIPNFDAQFELQLCLIAVEPVVPWILYAQF